MKVNLLKKYQKLFTSQNFFFMCAVCTMILILNLKNNNIFTVSKIQTMRKLNNPTTTPIAGFFLPQLDSPCLNDSIVNKETLEMTLLEESFI